MRWRWASPAVALTLAASLAGCSGGDDSPSNGASPVGTVIKDHGKRLGTVAQLRFYDWEPNVVADNGKELGDHATDFSAAELPIPTLLEAVQRAAKAKPLAEPTDAPPGVHTRDPAKLAAYDRKNDSAAERSDRYYIFDNEDQLVVGPESRLDVDAATHAQDDRVIKVRRGIVIVEAERPPNLKNVTPSYYVLEDDVELSGKDVRNPSNSVDPRTDERIIVFDFSQRGRKLFARVTRRIAQRGSEVVLPPGAAQPNAFQHFAITLGNRIVSRAFIDFLENPDGIDGRTGAQINAGLQFARR